jgi:catechol 2,3-dioxygenase-like lactoylglutathione lyase family enzyme
MQSHLYHLQINIDYAKNGNFYKELMTFLGWSVIFETEAVVGKYKGMAGYRSGSNGDLWFVDSTDKEVSNYDKVGVNHVSLRVTKQENVDEVIKFLESKGVKTLFGTPRHRPEFTSQESDTYYQIIFETPDKIQFEIVYIGAKL